ncbi:MAG: LamG domain-containing protein [Verrucomicrobiae bacterium]|nr:LamG domain-containing protein [Verrucomicrobiae bacterium]
MNSKSIMIWLVGLSLAWEPVSLKAGLHFDGNNDSIVVEQSVTEGLQEVSIMMWVKGEYKQSNLIYGPLVIHFWHGFVFYLSNQDKMEKTRWAKDMAASGRWHHFAITSSRPMADEGRIRLYIDGIRQSNDSTHAAGQNSILRGGALKFCGMEKYRLGSSHWLAFQGTLEDARIYDRALTENEVLKIYGGEDSAGAKNGMALWFPMRNKNAELMVKNDIPMIKDQSGNGNHGKITGAPIWKNDGYDEAAQKQREQIALTFKLMREKKAECEKQRQFLAKWFDDHPDSDKKSRARFEELNHSLHTNAICWTMELLRGYYDLQTKVIPAELFPETDGKKKEENPPH